MTAGLSDNTCQAPIKHIGIGDDLGGRREAGDHLSLFGIGKRDLYGEADGDHPKQRNDKRFDQRKPSFCR